MRAKISVLVEVEYEIDPENYPSGSSPDEMLAIDIAGAESDPYITLDSEGAKWTISGELLSV